MSHSFHNTTNLVGQHLARAESKAQTQEDVVLAVFDASRSGMLTPEDVLPHMPQGTPLTSVRRAISNLTERGLLRKTSQMREGKYGATIHYWSRSTGQLGLL